MVEHSTCGDETVQFARSSHKGVEELSEASEIVEVENAPTHHDEQQTIDMEQHAWHAMDEAK